MNGLFLESEEPVTHTILHGEEIDNLFILNI